MSNQIPVDSRIPHFTSNASRNIAEWGKIYLDEDTSTFTETEQDKLRSIKNNLQGWDDGKKINSWDKRFDAAKKSIEELYQHTSNKTKAQEAVDQLFEGVFQRDSYNQKKQQSDLSFKQKVSSLESILKNQNKPKVTNRATVNVLEWNKIHLDENQSQFSQKERKELELLRDNLRGVNGNKKLRTWDERFDTAKQTISRLYETASDKTATKIAVKQLFDGIFEHSEYYKTKQGLDLTFKRKVHSWKRYVEFGPRNILAQKELRIGRENKDLSVESSATRDSLVHTYKALESKISKESKQDNSLNEEESPNAEVFRVKPSEFEIIHSEDLLGYRESVNLTYKKNIDDRVFELLYQARTNNGPIEDDEKGVPLSIGIEGNIETNAESQKEQERESFRQKLITLSEKLYKHPKSEWRDNRAHQLYRARIVYEGGNDPISKKSDNNQKSEDPAFKRKAPESTTKSKTYIHGNDVMKRNYPIHSDRNTVPEKRKSSLKKKLAVAAGLVAITGLSAIGIYQVTKQVDPNNDTQTEQAQVKKKSLETKLVVEKETVQKDRNAYENAYGKIATEEVEAVNSKSYLETETPFTVGLPSFETLSKMYQRPTQVKLDLEGLTQDEQEEVILRETIRIAKANNRELLVDEKGEYVRNEQGDYILEDNSKSTPIQTNEDIKKETSINTESDAKQLEEITASVFSNNTEYTAPTFVELSKQVNNPNTITTKEVQTHYDDTISEEELTPRLKRIIQKATSKGYIAETDENGNFYVSPDGKELLFRVSEKEKRVEISVEDAKQEKASEPFIDRIFAKEETVEEKKDRYIAEMTASLEDRKESTKEGPVIQKSETVEEELSLGQRLGFTYTERPQYTGPKLDFETRMAYIERGNLEITANDKVEYATRLLEADISKYLSRAISGEESTIFNSKLVNNKIKNGHGLSKEFDLSTRLSNLHSVYVYSSNTNKNPILSFFNRNMVNQDDFQTYVEEVKNTTDMVAKKFADESMSEDEIKKRLLPRGDASVREYALALSFSGKPAHEFSQTFEDVKTFEEEIKSREYARNNSE